MNKLIFLYAAIWGITTSHGYAQYQEVNAHRSASPERTCTLTDRKISAMSFLMGEIGDLIEKCYYRSEKQDIGMLEAKFNSDSPFCVDMKDADTMLNHVLRNEFHNLRKITEKVTKRKVSQVSLSWFLEAKLQVLQIQSLLLQGKTYFLITDAGKGALQQININIRGLKDTVQYINNQLNTYNQIFVQYQDSFISIINIIKPAISKLKTMDNHLTTMVKKLDSLQKVIKQYIEGIEPFNYTGVLNEIKTEQRKTAGLLDSMKLQVTSIQQHQKKTRLIAVLSPLVMIAALIIFK